MKTVEMASELARARQLIPPPERHGEALARLMSEVEARTMRTSSNGTGLAGWLGGSRLRTVLAAATAAVVLGGAGLGVAAATGNEPARKLFGISSDSAIKVEFKGVVVEATATELRVDANGDLRIVTVDGATSFRGADDEDASIADITPGMIVEVHGRLLADNTILATRVNIDDDDDGIGTPGATQSAATATASPATPPPAATTTAPAAQPTFDDDDDRQDGDHQGDDDDEQGEDEDDHSGPGDGDDDEDSPDDEDSSGPGSGDDHEDESAGDNSGSGGSDDDGDEDHSDDSGSGGGDDGADDSSGDDD